MERNTETVEVHITKAANSPVRLHLDAEGNRYNAVVHVGCDAEIPAALVPLLKTTPDIQWRYVGEPGEAIAEPTASAFDADGVIEGTVEDVEKRLGSLTPEQLASVKEAEIDREKPRKGVLDAIEAEVNRRNEED